MRSLGRNRRVVMEGRDIGTVVFPDADLKFFLDASPEARSQRRFEQVTPDGSGSRGGSGSAQVRSAVARELREREERDRTRVESPLKPAADAIRIDSTEMTLDEVLIFIESQVRAHLSLPVVSDEL